LSKKKTVEITCPCSEYEYKLTYMSEDKGMEDLHCPFCGIVLSDSNEEYHSEDFEDEDD
jgi:hypothetical protein